MTVSVVVIGRNEGARLTRSLLTVLQQTSRVVYVDSHSRDDSCARARALGVATVELDPRERMSAARARNAGFDEAVARWPDTAAVQFLDGDMELVRGWLDEGAGFLRATPAAAAVFGWRREKERDSSVFNRLCDIEWRFAGLGLQNSFGGDVMVRVAAFRAVSGYDAAVIAAEDDELAYRLRARGFELHRIDHLSTFHDAAMTRTAQWWTRARRTGYAYAQVRDKTRSSAEKKFGPELRRVYVYGVAVPAVAAALAPVTLGLSAGLLLFYPLNAVRIGRDLKARGFDGLDSVLWGVSCASSVIPQAVGALQYARDRRARKAATIIEYKTVASPRTRSSPRAPSTP